MKYDRFEDLPVWQSAIDLAKGVYSLTRHALLDRTGDLRDQLRRASLSVSNNIAEGFERGTTAELIAYLYIARGSVGEVRSMLRFIEALCTERSASNSKSEISDLKLKNSELISLAESCSRQLRGWADSLQNSDIKGVKHLNEQTRNEYFARKRATSFQEQLTEMNEASMNRWMEHLREGQEPRENEEGEKREQG